MPKAASHTPRNDKDFQYLLHLLRENDESVTGIDMTEFDNAAEGDDGTTTVQSLGEALTEYTSCTYLQVNLFKLLSPSSHDVRLMTQSFAPLLQYIRSSRALRHVSVRAYNSNAAAVFVTTALLTQVASAIAKNEFIDTLEFAVHGSYIALPANALVTMSSGAHIRKFILVLLEEHLCTNQQQTMLAQALLANETLEDLKFVSNGRGDTATCILNELQGRCPNLLHLALILTQPPSMEHMGALERFIQAAATTLKSVFLDGYHFTVPGSGNLFALVFDSPIELSLSGCKFNAEATDIFVRAMQQAKSCAKPTHLLLVNAYTDVEFENKSPGTVLATALAGSWRSALRISQSLHNTGGNVPAILLTDLFHGMVANHCNIRLSCLLLGTLSAAGADALVRFLPLSSTLLTLNIDTLENDVNQRQLFHAIRRNGSLLSVKIEALTSSSVYGPRLCRILQRNLALPMLVSKGMLPLFPAAFLTAQEAPRMAPNNVLIGLTAAADDK